MKKIALACFSVSLFLAIIICLNIYQQIPGEANAYFEKQKVEMRNLAVKQVDSLFIHEHTDIFPIYNNCKPRYVLGDCWSQSGTLFRDLLYNTNYRDRLPNDVTSTYHFAPENPDYSIGDDFVDGIKKVISIQISNKDKETGIHRVDWKGLWQSGWALGVNENWGDGNLIQYIIIPYAVSFRKQDYFKAEELMSVNAVLRNSYEFYTENDKSDFKSKIVRDIDKFCKTPYINNDFYYLKKSDDTLITPTTITDNPRYVHYMYSGLYYVFIRAFGQKRWYLAPQTEHVQYLKDDYIAEKEHNIIMYGTIICGSLFVLMFVFIILVILDNKRDNLSMLQRVIRQSNPTHYINQYNKEMLDASNNIYDRALKTNEDDKEAIASLCEEMETKLGIYLIGKKEIENLKKICNPRQYMNPYNPQKLSQANEIYSKLTGDRMPYSEYISVINKISDLNKMD